MCDPVTCQQCRNIAGCKEAEAAVAAIDTTPQQVESLSARFQSVAEREVCSQKLLITHLREQISHLSDLNSDLMANNRHLKQLLQAIHSTAEVGL